MKKPNEQEEQYIKGYAQALQDVLRELTGINGISKHYDPISFTDTDILSYAFNLKDGGRTHPLKDYADINELKKIMLNEVCEILKLDL